LSYGRPATSYVAERRLSQSLRNAFDAGLFGFAVTTGLPDCSARAVVAQCPTSINRQAVRPNLVSVKTFTSGAETVEVCSVVRLGPRSRAFALQLRAGESNWRCSSLIVG
jgi:hypothetical protein